MARGVERVVGRRFPRLAMMLIGWIVSIPVFCDSGFVLVSPIGKSLARRTAQPQASLMLALGAGVLLGFGEASAERKAQFAAAVADAIKSFEDLDSQGVQIAVSNKDSVPQVTVQGGRISPENLKSALSVVLTNMSFKYPGIGFMATGDGGWRILMPNEMKIPRTGEFGLMFK